MGERVRVKGIEKDYKTGNDNKNKTVIEIRVRFTDEKRGRKGEREKTPRE